jgi:PTH1 family peptidyl-tRNA hydrolase
MRLAGSRAHVGEGSFSGQDVGIVKPLTYMNRSGPVVADMLASGDVDPSELMVAVDDVALPVGSIRIRSRGSSGGHNGLKSIDRSLQGAEYARLRIGVGPAPADEDLADFVLDRFNDEDAQTFVEQIPTLVKAVECWIDDGVEVAMNRFNKRVADSD